MERNINHDEDGKLIEMIKKRIWLSRKVNQNFPSWNAKEEKKTQKKPRIFKIIE